MHKILALTHHKHSGRLLPHHHTSYRALLLLLVLVGGLLAGTHVTLRQADAASYIVTAVIPMPAPDIASVITSPVANTGFTTQNITVTGTCAITTPAMSVIIYRNGTIAGSAPCSAEGTFSVYVPLSVGANTLIAKTATITGNMTPDSVPVTVTYTVPTTPPKTPESSKPTPTDQPAAPATPSSSPTKPAPQRRSTPTVHTDSAIVVFGPNQEAIWRGTIRDGTPPYTITIDWGDGTKTTLKGVKPGPKELRHTYTTMQPYVIQVRVTDITGAQLIASFAAVTPFMYTGTGQVSSQPFLSDRTRLLTAAYATYVTALAIFALFWYHSHRNRQQLAPARAPRHYAAAKKRKQKK